MHHSFAVCLGHRIPVVRRCTGTAAAPRHWLASFVRGGAVEAEYHDLTAPLFRWPGKARHAGRHGDPLRAVGSIGDHAATDRVAEVLAPQLPAVGGIDRVEVAAYVAEEHDASGALPPTIICGVWQFNWRPANAEVHGSARRLTP
jgi:hypothetical protein